MTPNLAELAVLAGRDVVGWADALAAAEELSAEIGAAVLVKGGHLEGEEAPDALIDARRGLREEFAGARIATAGTHGTGCSLSSALATRLALGEDPRQAVASARAWLRESLRDGDALRVGTGHGPVSHFAGLWSRGGVDTRPTPARVAADWWQHISGIRDAIDDLPFIRRLADGTLEREPFLFYLAQDALYLREYARVLAEAARLAPTSDEQAFWAHSAHGSIVGELELHASWLTPEQGVGAQTSSAAPSSATTAYLDHLRSVAFGGDYAELVAAILPCFWLYTDLGRRLHAGEFGAAARDPQHPYASWLATYADPAFEEATAQAIAHVSGAASTADAETRARMLRAFEVSSAHELAFFAAPMDRHPVV
ncbi:bifunctional hydroxymethylpyrimidine kinase/phosphomethylpyrimidine kinase [Microbacterium sp. W4I20]|uniref:bifunctional hydroxymethylpyrimidine kinase/phosphomethylpyrimidine kinase n=1 Tax=Microbacterium sp. W4I20 TaxID=3042262 RepID=UPI002788BCEE|nr:bifunctional hydroxymethylpyrimidine kinase/phosphomethylpyrimidine kinase [Microbacterium sp. W4I20]MDQ0729053.1 thiaminase [Microbacterium sp. W4I20]